MFHIALVEPQIPPNTGNIARLCAAMNCHLHLVRPLGFATDDRTLKRAGLDYWPQVRLTYYDSLELFLAAMKACRSYYLTTKSHRSYTSVQFQKEDVLVFGSETTGLPASLLKQKSDSLLTVPMPGKIRSLNLSSTVAMVVGEAMRQVVAGGGHGQDQG